MNANSFTTFSTRKFSEVTTADKCTFQNNAAQKFRARISHMVRQEAGNVESTLVLIPMLILFIIGVQLIIATNIRNTEMALAQGDASGRAISHQFRAGDEIVEVGGGIEKIQVLVTHRISSLPQLVPGLASLMGDNPVADVIGIAVIEPTNQTQ
jgi:hypothetical protein